MPLSVTVCAGTLCALDSYIQAAAPQATGTADVVSLECARCDMKTTDLGSVFPLLVALTAPRSRLAHPPQVCRSNNCHFIHPTDAPACVNFHYETPTSMRLLQLPKYLLYADLSQNKITSLHALEQLHYLVYLNVSGNRLATLKGLQHCGQLRELSVSNNRLSDVSSLAGMLPYF